MDIDACETLKLVAAPILSIKLNMSQRLQNMRINFSTKKKSLFLKSRCSVLGSFHYPQNYKVFVKNGCLLPNNAHVTGCANCEPLGFAQLFKQWFPFCQAFNQETKMQA